MVIGGAVVAFLAARWFAVESVAVARRAEWAARPEVENWADPYAGLREVDALLALGLGILVVGTLVALVLVHRRAVSA